MKKRKLKNNVEVKAIKNKVSAPFLLIVMLTVGIIVAGSSSLSYFTQTKTKHVKGDFAFSFDAYSIHTEITVYKGTELILNENHAGNVTNLGDNMTLYKLWGDTDMQYGSLNTTALPPFISIGNYTSAIANTATVLPEEWHREVSAIDGETQSQLNVSCTISGGDITGTQVADCIGVCFTETDDANDLWGFDTFTEVTGIDNTFTITVDIQISVAHT